MPETTSGEPTDLVGQAATKMPTATPPLASRLARTDEVGEAISLVLGRAVAEGGLERAFALHREGGRYRVLGLGHGDEACRSLEEAVEDPDTPVGGAVRAGEPARLPDPTAEGGEVTVLPLGTEAWGAVLIDADAPDSGTEALRSVLEEHQPALDRIWAVRQLRRQHRTVARERDLLTTIVNCLPDPVVLTDASNNIVLANDRADQLFSTRTSDSEGRRRAVQLNNLLFSSFLTRAVISSRTAMPRELNLVDPSDGSDLLFEVLPTPVPRVGMEDAYLSILRNITDLKRAVTELETQFQRSRIAEERVREEWERLNATLENVGDPILVTDDHSNIILMNREAEALFESQRPDGEQGSGWRRAVRANDTKFTSLMSDFLLHPEPRRVEKLELQEPGDGGRFPAEVVSSKIINARGEPTAIVSVIHDLTQVVENERLARQLSELNDELEERIRLATVELEERNRRLEWQSRELERASRLKSEFLASMSHELRTPINAVIGYTSLLREEIYGALTEKQKSGLDKVNIASQHLLELINDILDLSKIEAGKMPVHLEEVSLRQVVGELTEAIDPLAREKGLDLVVDAEPDMPNLFTDRTKLKQILLNLLSNAIKFTSEGGVTLQTRMVAEDRVLVAVEDTGIGIKEEDLETVFADFRQVDQSPTREYGGTGLGLTITRKLVALLHGEIRVQSVYGEGSVFTVELPLRLKPGTREEQVQRALAPDVTRTGGTEDGGGDD